MLKGSLVAIVTPMQPDGSLDIPALHALIEFHLSQRTDGIVVVGTTGESPTVVWEEHCELIRTTVEQVNGRVPVIAGTGANSTQEALELTAYAQRVGADACLLVTPYYNKPTQEGLYQHFATIAKAVDIPQLLYNVPGRTGCDLSNETVLRLATIPNIVGIKDATGNLERGTELLQQAPENFAVYSGDDATAMALMMAGGHGVISVTANVAPEVMHDLCQAVFDGNFQRARDLNARLIPLHKKLFLESNPIPVKWALHRMGLIPSGIRLPLTPLAPQYHASLTEALQSAGIL